MKKVITVLLFFPILFLYACSSPVEPKDTIAIPIKVTAKLGGTDAVFTADIFELGCDITFDSSHPLAGTKLELREYGNTATNGDFKRSVVEGIFPAQESLVKAIRALAETDISGIETENGVKYTIDEMTIMVYYDKSAKLITGIETEKDGRRFDFTVVGLEPYEGQSSSEG